MMTISYLICKTEGDLGSAYRIVDMRRVERN